MYYQNNHINIAFVKQEVYPDLYVCKNRTPIKELLFSSAGRVGPFGLFQDWMQIL